MANKHYDVERDYEITLKFKVKATHISNYYHLSEEGVKSVLDDLEDELKTHFMWKLAQEHTIESVGADFVRFEIVD